MNQFATSFLSCLVIEPDASSRWMLSFLLQDSGPSLGEARIAQIVAECETLEMGLVRVDALRTTSQPVQVILLGSGRVDEIAPVVDAIGRFAPEIAIVILGQSPASSQVVKELGVSGYWWKGDRPEILLEILRGLQPVPRAVQPSRMVVSPAIAALGRLSRSTDLTSLGNALGNIGQIDSRFSTFDRALAQLDFQLRSQRLNRPTRWFLQGRIREILAARWVAQKILPSQAAIQPKFNQLRSGQPRSSQSRSNPVDSLSVRNDRSKDLNPVLSLSRPLRSESGLAPQSRSRNLEIDRLSMIFDQFIVKLDAARTSPLGGLDNLSLLPLELDLLNESLKVKLLSLTAQVLQAESQALRSESLGLADLHDRVPFLLESVWSVVLTQFFRSDDSEEMPLESLLRSRPGVSQLLLRRIPLVASWIAYGLLEMPLSLDNQLYAPGTPQADGRALLLLENTIFGLANAVLQPLLNQFSEVEGIKRRYFHGKFVSSRELARFRNDLSWRYRRDRWLDTPTDIFESQYRIYYLSPQGIAETKLYAPRQQELQSLAGFPLAVTLVLETRDAIAPRLKATFAFLGTGVVYFLTEIVGRGIGLVGQGIVKGIGNAWQERR
jgi:hypothetical protein